MKRFILLLALLAVLTLPPGPHAAWSLGPQNNTQLITGSSGSAVSGTNPLPVSTEGTRATYGYAATGITPAATPTDVVVLCGSSTRTVAVKRVAVSGQATTAGTMDVVLLKRTAANTGGTATTPTPAKYDSTDASATATLSQYSANATSLGTGIALRQLKLNMGVAGAAGNVDFDFAIRNDRPLILRGATQCMAVNFNGGTVPTGGALAYGIEWEER